MATPIGTLDDLGRRAVQLLSEVDLILSEDTRRTRSLLAHLEIPGGQRLHSLHEHNEQQRLEWALSQLADGRDIALVSDAGTPVLSDPGFLLVRAARRRGLRLLSLPGPSSFTAALAASGQPPLPATLVGFLPPRRAARRRRLSELASAGWTLVVLLSPHRLAAETADLASVLGEDRPATLLCELSKAHERAEMSTLGEIACGREVEHPRGEYVLVVGPARQTESTGRPAAEDVRRVFAEATDAGLSRQDALRSTASRLGLRRREVYEIVFVAGKGGGSG